MKSFLTASGLADPLQLIVEYQSGEGGELRLLHQPFALIGRDPRADLVLDHVHVSRRHVYFQVIDGRAFWVDLGSRTGTLADGELQKFGWLQGGRTLCVGPFVIRRFVGDDKPADRLPQETSPFVTPFLAVARNQGPFSEVTLEFLNGPSQAVTWPIRRVMSLIGSASGCKFRLTDASVSRFHASLLRTRSGLWIVDLLGQRGITVNEAPVRFSHLADGDLLRIGRYQIRVRCRLSSKVSSDRSADHASATPLAQEPRRGSSSSSHPHTNWPGGTSLLMPGTVASQSRFPLMLPALSSSTIIDTTRSEAAFPTDSLPAELTDSILMPLVSQFGLMQQQMFDQFQQAMAMMVQMFGTMHRDQMAVIREELDQLRDLTEEFHVLKTELANREAEQAATSSSAPARASAALDQAAAPKLDASLNVMASEKAADPKTAQTNTMAPVSDLPAAQASSEDLEASGAHFRPKTSGASTPADSARDSVVWLHQRIMTLQRERESRWQKILKLLPGVS